ncbi:MAG: PrsW family intramembrane metalloprotease [Ignavibacteriaceae bacterium]|nr:PrsW family intramembrane metalloprotease [Ignavibacteriaceae bacterium]
MPFLISFLPILLLLFLLYWIDSFKLLSPKILFIAILWGAASALLAYPINTFLLNLFSNSIVTGLLAPTLEESLKFLLIIHFLRKNRVCFLTDSLILGFAVGAGFSIVENIFYLNQLGEKEILIWILRGFGTSFMHATASGTASVISQTILGKKDRFKFRFLLIGLTSAVIIHGIFNSSLFPPVFMIASQLLLLPMFIFLLMQKSEASIKNWIDEQFESDVILLSKIKSGELSTTRTGKYLISVKERFPAEVLVDMLGYVQLYLTLSIKVKGMLMIKEAGFDIPKDENIMAQLNELNALSKSIGKIGRMTLSPILKTNQKDFRKLTQLINELNR